MEELLIPRHIFYLAFLMTFLAQRSIADGQFVVGSCEATDSFDLAISTCSYMGYGVKLAEPKTPVQLSSALAVYSQLCMETPVGELGSNAYVFWVNAQCVMDVAGNYLSWPDGTTSAPGLYCIGPSPSHVFYYKTTLYDGWFIGQGVVMSIAGILCERLLCPANSCRGDTTTIAYTYQQQLGCCLCNSAIKADGPRCQCALGTESTDCDATTTSAVAYLPSSQTCQCTCLATHTGSRCDQRFCTIALDCNARASSVSGVAGSCQCSCNSPYTGTSCEQQLCLNNPDCNSRAELVSGVLPNCQCTCSAGYSGSRCQYRICTVSQDCNAHATSATGIDPNCQCSCNQEYTGPSCQTRICHVNVECQGRGLSIQGLYPDCVCRCQLHYGGRNCRLLTDTLSLPFSRSSSSSRSISLTPSLSPSRSRPSFSISIITSFTVTLLSSISLSGLGSGTLTESLTISDSLSHSPSETVAQSFSHSQLLSRSHSLTVSPSPGTPTESATLTNSTTASHSMSLTCSHSPSETVAQSDSHSTAASRSHSLTVSLSPGTPTGSATLTNSTTASHSMSLTCKDLDDLNVNNTCSVLRPLPSDWTPPTNDSSAPILSSEWLTGTSDCTTISVPYGKWTGRQGAIHTIGIAAVDSRVPLKATLSPPTIHGTDLIEPADLPRMELAPLSLTVDHTKTNSFNYFTAIVAIRYTGRSTLNKLHYTLTCAEWTRCPIAMPGIFQVFLDAPDRLLPVPVAEAVSAGNAIVSVIGALSVSPTTVAQLGVLSSLRAMSRCSNIDLDSNDDDDSYEGYTSGTQNPFGLAIGGNGGRRFIRGALATSLFYLLALSALMLVYTTASSRVAIWLAPDQRAAPQPLLTGYPSALIAVVSFAMDIVAAAGTLLVAYGAGWGDRLVGLASVAACLLYISHIIFVTACRFPSTLDCTSTEDTTADPKLDDSLLYLTPSPSQSINSDIDSVLGDVIGIPPQVTNKNWRLSALFTWLTNPTHKWQHPKSNEEGDRAAREWLARNESYIADARIGWYCGLEQGVALLVCILGALSYSEMAYCIARGVTCTLLIGAQAIVMIVMKPPIHKWRWLLMSTVLSLQLATAALSVANAPLQQQELELAMDCLGVLVFVIMGVVTAADVARLLVEVHRTAIRALANARKKVVFSRKRRTMDVFGQSTDQQLRRINASFPKNQLLVPQNVSFSIRSSTGASARAGVRNVSFNSINREDLVVRSILEQLSVYEATLAEEQTSSSTSSSTR